MDLCTQPAVERSHQAHEPTSDEQAGRERLLSSRSNPDHEIVNSSLVSNVFAQVPPHVIVENAFGRDMAERLLTFALTNEARFNGTQVGRKGAVQKAIRRSRNLRDFGSLRGDLEQRFRAAMHSEFARLGSPSFTVAELELELAAHGDGDYYRRHIDTFAGTMRANLDRVITAVYYFHRLPRSFTGGALRLFSVLPPEQGGSWIDVEPLNDRLLLFPAWAPHEVLQVSSPERPFADSRFAINCWYKQARVTGQEVDRD